MGFPRIRDGDSQAGSTGPLSSAGTVHIGNSLAGPVLGTASPDALGAWSLRLTGPPPDDTRTVSVESTRGGVLLGFPLVVRN